MAVDARKRRRVPYEKLRERLWESQLPFDCDAERHAIGAVLLAPNGWARKLSGKLYSGHFYDQGHGWLWEELGTALCRSKLLLDDSEQIGQWLEGAKLLTRFKERFHGSGFEVLRDCLDGCYWYHGRWYIDRVLVASKLRSSVIHTAKLFHEALVRAEGWE